MPRALVVGGWVGWEQRLQLPHDGSRWQRTHFLGRAQAKRGEDEDGPTSPDLAARRHWRRRPTGLKRPQPFGVINQGHGPLLQLSNAPAHGVLNVDERVAMTHLGQEHHVKQIAAVDGLVVCRPFMMGGGRRHKSVRDGGGQGQPVHRGQVHGQAEEAEADEQASCQQPAETSGVAAAGAGSNCHAPTIYSRHGCVPLRSMRPRRTDCNDASLCTASTH